MNRCPWCLGDELYIKYHDEEWGKPVFDDKKLFEMLLLEMMQAGLSWITVLRKRENYRKAFDNFDVRVISSYDDNKVSELLENPGIIRNRRKIAAAINNARLFLEVQEAHGSFGNFIWSYVNHEPLINHYESIKEIPATSVLSDRISKDLKKLGFSFAGSTIIYSYLQAVGIINDHIDCCDFK